MTQLVPFAQIPLDFHGKPVPGGQVWIYKAGTLEPAEVFMDSAGTIRATHPVILSAQGELSAWVDPTQLYRVILKDFGGHRVIYEVDDFSVVRPTSP